MVVPIDLVGSGQAVQYRLPIATAGCRQVASFVVFRIEREVKVGARRRL